MYQPFTSRLSMWILVPALVFFSSDTSRADLVFSRFEEPDLATKLNADQAWEGLVDQPSSFRSGNVSFANDGVSPDGTTWGGIGFSRRTTRPVGQNLYDHSNDLISKPGHDAGGVPGSATWAIVGGGGVMTADANYLFQTLDLTNTLYAWTSMTTKDPFAGDEFGPGDFFTVTFTNTNPTPNKPSKLDFDLANFRNGNTTLLTDWQTIDVSSLGASQLSISFSGSRTSVFGGIEYLDTPAYVALDNISVFSPAITAVPEPSSLLLMALAGGGLVHSYRKRLTKARKANAAASDPQ